MARPITETRTFLRSAQLRRAKAEKFAPEEVNARKIPAAAVNDLQGSRNAW